jgi:four helix bundle protein
MAGARDIRELVAWQLARRLKLLADEVCGRPEASRDFKFRDQLRDSAASGPRNIAEGFGRFGHKEFARFVRIAKGSEVEVLNHFIDAVDKRYIGADELPTLEHAARKAIKAATGLIRHLESTPDPPTS